MKSSSQLYRVRHIEDFRDMLGGLARAVNHFRKPAAQRAVMIDLGKADILKRRDFQLQNSFVYRNSAVFDILQDLFYRIQVLASKSNNTDL